MFSSLKLQRRGDIETFCLEFLQGDHKHLHHIINTYHEDLARIDIDEMHLNKTNFNSSFEMVCDILLWKSKHNNGHIIAILGYALLLHEHHIRCHSYSINILTQSLTNVLDNMNFKPDQLAGSYFCILL